jgi:hypothetical protein
MPEFQAVIDIDKPDLVFITETWCVETSIFQIKSGPPIQSSQTTQTTFLQLTFLLRTLRTLSLHSLSTNRLFKPIIISSQTLWTFGPCHSRQSREKRRNRAFSPVFSLEEGTSGSEVGIYNRSIRKTQNYSFHV